MNVIRPKTDEIQKFAFELFERRGCEHGGDSYDWILAEQALTFHKNYERLSLYKFNERQLIPIEKPVPHLCRFCGKQPPNATFQTDAHAIPELLGNNNVFLQDECDICNHFFGKYLEDHLAKMLAGTRSLATIRGKKGVPSYKSNDKQSRIDVKNGKINKGTPM